MIRNHDLAAGKQRRIEPVDMVRSAVINRQSQRLIEITIKKTAVPRDGQHGPAHDVSGRARIKCICQRSHVFPVVIALDKKRKESSARIVGKGKEAVKTNTLLGPKPALVFLLNGLLRSRPKRSDRVVNQIEY